MGNRTHNGRVRIEPSDRRVRVAVGGEVVAESARPLLLHETGLKPRWYLPRADVRTDLLRPTDKHTRCPWKGEASYFSVGDEEDVAWSYEAPIPGCEQIAGAISFYDDRVELTVG